MKKTILLVAIVIAAAFSIFGQTTVTQIVNLESFSINFLLNKIIGL